jgi:hypothetical protein
MYYAFDYVAMMVPTIPSWIVWIVGLFLAVRALPHRRRTATLTLVGVVTFMVGSLSQLVAPIVMHVTESSTLQVMQLVFLGFSVVLGLFEALGFALLLTAIFSRPGDEGERPAGP